MKFSQFVDRVLKSSNLSTADLTPPMFDVFYDHFRKGAEEAEADALQTRGVFSRANWSEHQSNAAIELRKLSE